MAILNKRERRKLAILIASDIAISIADILFLALLLFIIQFYTQSSRSNRLSFLPDWILDRNSLLLISLFFLLFSVKNLLGFLVYRHQCRFLTQVASRISENKLLQYLEGTYSDYINVDSAIHIRKINHQPLEFCQHILGGIQQLITQTALIVLTIMAMLFFSAKLFFLLFLILLPPIVAVFYLIKKRLHAVRKYAQLSVEKSLQHLQEALSGFVESNIYNKNNFFLKRYARYQQEFNKYLSDLLIVQGIPNRMIEIFALMGLFILIAINKWFGGSDNTIIITVGAFMAAAYKIIPGIVKILNVNGQISTYAFTIPELMQKNGAPGKVNIQDANKSIHSVQFKDVCFQYESQSILKDLNFTGAAGDFIGLSGKSGIGKTTIMNLLMGFLSPTKGQVIINDIPADIPRLQGYWQNISYVKQQSFLIHDTILKNIILEENAFDKEKLDKSIQAAGLAELIDSFPEKMDKIIVENGKNISGGQRQRIAIARALYKDADLIILDEPFNELDEFSESSLLNHFWHLSQAGKLVILITHSKSSLSVCTKIISLDEK